MLVDIFARRYEDTTLRDAVEERDTRLIVQATRILTEDVWPYPSGTKEGSAADVFWSNLHSRLSRELGLTELSPQFTFYTTKWNGKDVPQSYKNNPLKRCEKWLLAPVAGSPDRHIKERLSLIELGFREREEQVATMNAQPISYPARPAAMIGVSGTRPSPRDYGKEIKEQRNAITRQFRATVDELNTRLRQAKYPLHYHNGFIQAATDPLVQEQVETPFWSLVAAPPWENVDTDMKEALDLRDTDGRDPAFYAARALESTIKIISDTKGWTTKNERGAHNFIDNLAAKARNFIDPWEAKSLKEFFTEVRNPFGHGAGSAKMPSLTRPQTEWAIEFSMSWIKSLIRRL